jgi:hypothetical protein
MYYCGEAELPGGGTKTRIMRAIAPVSDPENFTPAGIALEFPASIKVVPAAGDSPEGYYTTSGPFHAAVTPWLNAAGERATDPVTGAFRTWWMYFTTQGNNAGVAVSVDGGVTFQLAAGKNPMFPFETRLIDGVWRRNSVVSKSKPYDYGQIGSACVVRETLHPFKFHMLMTAVGASNLTVDDMGTVLAEVGHENGKITDIGLGYADSMDALTFTRRTSQSMGVTSPAARGSGRVVDPRRHDGPTGAFEYIVSRPMIFRDVDVWRALVSSHSKTYRARSLTSTDFRNWTWDTSPADGFLGFGTTGAFDDAATAYPCAIRIGDTYHLWYTGNGYGHIDNAPTGIGYATASAI